MGITDTAISRIDLEGLAAQTETLSRCKEIAARFTEHFGRHEQEMLLSAPGRMEIGGNHTDHQNGCVLAAAVHLDVLGAAARNGKKEIRVISEGYPAMSVGLDDLGILEADAGTAAALVRGVADGFQKRGYAVGGFDAYVQSRVLNGSGLSSSASFEVWLAAAINHLFNEGRASAVELAQIGQYAENEHFKKPCGLEDQIASAVGGLVFVDFSNPVLPQVEKLCYDLSGYTICVIDSGADHAGLTDDYAAIRSEMVQIATFFNKAVLNDVEVAAFYANVKQLRGQVGERAVLRAFHFFQENERVKAQRAALMAQDIPLFLSYVRESGQSSYMYLQNVVRNTQKQELAICLAFCDKLLQRQGAFRVQGGGFAGTVEAFVPDGLMGSFQTGMEALLGKGCCHTMKIRKHGAVRLV